MLKLARPRVTYANVTSTLALFLVLTTGTVYAANEWTGRNIKDSSLTGADIKNGSLTSSDIKGQAGTATSPAVNGGIGTVDISGQQANPANGTAFVDGTITQWDVRNGSLTSDDIADNTIASVDVAPLHGDLDIQDNTITTFDLADNSVDADEVLDFGLTNEDVGVLFAQVSAAGAVDNSSGGVTATRVALGQFEVDFGRNVSACGAVATQGEAGTGGAPGALMGVTDRSGNVNAFFVTVRGDAGAFVDRAFQIIVVC